MGMLEKRAMKEAQDNWVPKRQQELNDICGGEIPYEIEWDTFANDTKAIQWLEHNACQQVAMAARVICKDDIGKEAMRDGCKRVLLRNVASPEEKSLVFENQELSLDCAFAQSPKGRFSDREIRSLLESKL